jgi:hypothetical protein
MVFLCTLNTLQNTCLRSPSATSQSGATACRCAMLQQHLPQSSGGTTCAHFNGCGVERITRPSTSGWSAAPAPPISADMAVGTISASRHRILVLWLGGVVADDPSVVTTQPPQGRKTGGLPRCELLSTPHECTAWQGFAKLFCSQHQKISQCRCRAAPWCQTRPCSAS